MLPEHARPECDLSEAWNTYTCSVADRFHSARLLYSNLLPIYACHGRALSLKPLRFGIWNIKHNGLHKSATCLERQIWGGEKERHFSQRECFLINNLVLMVQKLSFSLHYPSVTWSNSMTECFLCVSVCDASHLRLPLQFLLLPSDKHHRSIPTLRTASMQHFSLLLRLHQHPVKRGTAVLVLTWNCADRKKFV